MDGKLWLQSNYGEDLDFTISGEFVQIVPNKDDIIKSYRNGTSISAALMTGIIGRIKQRYGNLTIND